MRTWYAWARARAAFACCSSRGVCSRRFHLRVAGESHTLSHAVERTIERSYLSGYPPRLRHKGQRSATYVAWVPPL